MSIPRQSFYKSVVALIMVLALVFPSLLAFADSVTLKEVVLSGCEKGKKSELRWKDIGFGLDGKAVGVGTPGDKKQTSGKNAKVGGWSVNTGYQTVSFTNPGNPGKDDITTSLTLVVTYESLPLGISGKNAIKDDNGDYLVTYIIPIRIKGCPDNPGKTTTGQGGGVVPPKKPEGKDVTVGAKDVSLCVGQTKELSNDVAKTLELKDPVRTNTENKGRDIASENMHAPFAGGKQIAGPVALSVTGNKVGKTTVTLNGASKRVPPDPNFPDVLDWAKFIYNVTVKNCTITGNPPPYTPGPGYQPLKPGEGTHFIPIPPPEDGPKDGPKDGPSKPKEPSQPEQPKKDGPTDSPDDKLKQTPHNSGNDDEGLPPPQIPGHKTSMEDQGDNAHLETTALLTSEQFTVPEGTIKVNCPEDMAAGDQVSCSVQTEAQGDTPEEKQANEERIKEYQVELQSTATLTDDSHGPRLVSILVPAAAVGGGAAILLHSPDGHTVGEGHIPVHPPHVGETASGITDDFQIPQETELRKPMQIKGHFASGGSENTEVLVDDKPAPILAKSPRSLVVDNPSTTPGPKNVVVREGDRTTEKTVMNQGTADGSQVAETTPCQTMMGSYKADLFATVNQGWHPPKPPAHGTWTVTLEYDVAKEGQQLQNLHVAKSSGYGPLDESALARVSQLQGSFKPLPSCYNKSGLHVEHLFKVVYQ